MTSMIRTTIRWIARAGATILIAITAWVSAAAFPQPFFEHKTEIGPLVFYSDQEFDSEMEQVLADVHFRLRSNELYEADRTTRIFLCSDQSLYSIYARLTLLSPLVQGFNISLLNNSFVSEPRVTFYGKASNYRPKYGVREGSLARVIAHEVMHQFVMNALGFGDGRNLPLWKSEGYPEYGANIAAIRADNSTSLRKRIEVLHDDFRWAPGGYTSARVYFRAGLMVEYLSEIENYRFADIMHDSVTEYEVYDAMMSWHRRGGIEKTM